MSMQNLAIVFGPTLFGQHAAVNGQGGAIADTTYQNQVRIGCQNLRKFLDRIESFSGNRNYSQSLYGYLYRRIRMILFIFLLNNHHDASFCVYSKLPWQIHTPHPFFVLSLCWNITI